jgi:UDP-glucose 4-epimerase
VSASASPIAVGRIVVLGHTGFIGGGLLRRLAETNPGIPVRGFSPTSVNLENPASFGPLRQALTPDTALVLCSAIKRQLGDSLETFSRNMHMVANLCRLLDERPPGRVIFFSSAAVYGEDVVHDTITEQTLVEPVSFYGIGKFAAERIFLKQLGGRTSLVFLRPATVYGPGDRGFPYGPSLFCRAAVEGKTVTLWGDGTELREFIYIDDMIELTRRLIFDDFQGALNIVSGVSYSFQDILAEVRRHCPDMPKPDSRPRSKNKVDNHFDNTLLSKRFPDFNFTPLADGVRQTVESLRCN